MRAVFNWLGRHLRGRQPPLTEEEKAKVLMSAFPRCC